jgi:hypothetical protein
MAKTYYMPRIDKERAAWLKNFGVKFGGYSPTFGFVAADVTSVLNDSNMFIYSLDTIETFKTELRERTQYKDILRDGPLGSVLGAVPSVPTLPAAPAIVAAGIFPRISAIVKRIKAHPNYTEAIGKDLGIIGSESVEVFAIQKPILSITKEGGNVIIKYTRGSADGLQIFSKRGSETAFTQLAVITKTTYKDTRPNLIPGQPETRIYQAWFTKDDTIIGQISDDVTFVV